MGAFDKKMASIARYRVLNQHKNMLWLGHDWHQGYDRYQKSLSGAFRANKGLESPEAIEAKLAHAEFVEREIIALYKLKRYRGMRRRYGAPNSYDIEVQRINELVGAKDD